ncbi:DHA2 family efflux MFS transporter permease subunit [Gordonia jinghuaiqii]|uniref:DHA2 family efflux MFS transporter permease subunit n=1 Tax=Gordonia jinghuaiqii TaxID=2758710 RepID=A0A7D7R091_9ACTN|nr:DHA2 family efflux MFS transporter permease subunit [Gordonia jinghuaiqii]MCR5978863.1 DHA2 family efflux MFS transporter permease subunit [Gordonia jinghuaiqii]QMT01791.1 DHA2 family efflux MFS transporter permease subunit [Gordonia jinghuaiqii]
MSVQARVDDSQEPRAGRREWLGLGVLATGLSMIVIDGTIVNVSLPVIIDELKLDLTDAQWINSLYSVVFAALLLSAGRLSDRVGRRLLFIVGVAVFLGGSLLAALADSSTTLILARLVQGIGGALVLPCTLSTVNATFRGRDRVIAFAIWGSVISGMAAIGPLLGGWLTTDFSWRWIFLVNVPIGILVVLGALLVVPETKAEISVPGLDVVGLLLSMIGFGALIFALIEGQSIGWWKPVADLRLPGVTWSSDAPVSATPVMGVVGLAALAAFVAWERHRARVRRSALLDLSLFRFRTFSWGNFTAMTVAIGEFGLLLVLPLFLVNAYGLSTLGAGYVLAVMALGAFASGGAARPVAARFGAPRTVMIGLALEVIGVLAFAFYLRPSSSAWVLALLLAVYGAGLGLASAQLTGTVLVDIPTDESGQGSATQSTARQLGAALGTAILGTILSLGLAHSLTDRLEPVALPAQVSTPLVDATRDSAGSTIPVIRDEGDRGRLGADGPEVADALSDGFADATRWSLFVAGGFLFAGLVTSTQLQPRRRPDPTTAG